MIVVQLFAAFLTHGRHAQHFSRSNPAFRTHGRQTPATQVYDLPLPRSTAFLTHGRRTQHSGVWDAAFLTRGRETHGPAA